MEVHKISGFVCVFSGEPQIVDWMTLQIDGFKKLADFIEGNKGLVAVHPVIGLEQARSYIADIRACNGKTGTDKAKRADLMQKLRLGLNLDPKEYAGKVGASVQTVYRWENSMFSQPPRSSVLSKIEQLYKEKIQTPESIVLLGSSSADPSKKILIVGKIEG